MASPEVKRLACLTFLALVACSGEEPVVQDEVAGTALDCALDGSAEWSSDCRAEMVQDEGRVILVAHHPDGSFRRLVLHSDGSVSAADGADKAVSTVSGGAVEVRVAQDRYRIPAGAAAAVE